MCILGNDAHQRPRAVHRLPRLGEHRGSDAGLWRSDAQRALGFAFRQLLFDAVELPTQFGLLVGMAGGEPCEVVAVFVQRLLQRSTLALQPLQGLALSQQLGLALLQLIHGDVAFIQQPLIAPCCIARNLHQVALALHLRGLGTQLRLQAGDLAGQTLRLASLQALELL
ncbi:hypothetical protein D9M68_879720 [compost metagenome]